MVANLQVFRFSVVWRSIWLSELCNVHQSNPLIWEEGFVHSDEWIIVTICKRQPHRITHTAASSPVCGAATAARLMQSIHHFHSESAVLCGSPAWSAFNYSLRWPLYISRQWRLKWRMEVRSVDWLIKPAHHTFCAGIFPVLVMPCSRRNIDGKNVLVQPTFLRRQILNRLFLGWI